MLLCSWANHRHTGSKRKEVWEKERKCAHAVCVWWSCACSSKVIKSDTWIKITIVIFLWTFDKHYLNVSASRAARLIGLFSFSSNSLNMVEMRGKKELMGEIMELTCNPSTSVYIRPTHTHTLTHTKKQAHLLEDAHALMHIPACSLTDVCSHKRSGWSG